MSEKDFGGMEERVPTSSEDIFHDTCEKIDKILAFKQSMAATFGGGADMIENSYRIIKEHSERAIKDEPIEAKNSEVQSVERAIDYLTDLQLNKPLTPIYKDLLFLLIPLYNNWNNNCIKSKDIGSKLSFLERMFRNSLTMEELFFVMRKLLHEAKKILEYSPPAFKLSRAYSGVIEAELNAEKP